LPEGVLFCVVVIFGGGVLAAILVVQVAEMKKAMRQSGDAASPSYISHAGGILRPETFEPVRLLQSQRLNSCIEDATTPPARNYDFTNMPISSQVRVIRFRSAISSETTVFSAIYMIAATRAA
jgi:hypothetical protein